MRSPSYIQWGRNAPRAAVQPHASSVNPAFPVFGNPTTQSVRDNFQHIVDDYGSLSGRLDVLEAGGGGGGGGGLTAPTGPMVGSNGTALGSVVAGSGHLTLSGSFPNMTLMLANVGTAGTYTTPDSITTDAFGRVTSVTAGTGGTGAGLPTTGGTLGTNASPQPPTAATLLQLAGPDTGNVNTALAIDAVGVPLISLRKMLGSMAAPTFPGNGHQLGIIEIIGWTGSGFGSGFQLQAGTGQAWTATNQGTTLSFLLTPNNSTTRQRVMFVGNQGGVVIGNPAGGDMGFGTLNVGSDIFVNGMPLDDYIATL
jgi:hypothetical protein